MTLPLPREHGTWGILLVPFATAAAIAGEFNLRVAVALLAVLLAFLARFPLAVWLLPSGDHRRPSLSPHRARRWALIYGLAAVLAGAVLIALWQLEELLGVAAVSLVLFLLHLGEARRGAARGWVAEILGTMALTLSAPVAWIAATGGFDATGLLVWLFNAAFFLAGLVYVKARIRSVVAGRTPASGRGRAEVSLVWVVHLGVTLLVAVLALRGWVSPLVLLPFLVATAVRAGWGGQRWGERFAIRRLGWNEVAHSLVFAVLLVVAFRL